MKTTDFASGFFGAGGRCPLHHHYDIHKALRGDGDDRIKVVEDASENEYNAENTTCCVLDVSCDDGTVRIGYYSDGAQSVIDVLAPDDTLESWAGGWDADGVMPAFLWRNRETITAEYRGVEYTATGDEDDAADSRNAAREELASQLPAGQEGDRVKLTLIGDGICCDTIDGALEWNGEEWEYRPSGAFPREQ